MSKRTIQLVAAAAVGTLILGILPVVILTAAHLTLSSAMFGGTLALFLLGCVLGVAAWLMGLMATARLGRWDWFIAVLALGPLGALIYGFGGPTERATA
jgi:hypothetical protein